MTTMEIGCWQCCVFILDVSLRSMLHLFCSFFSPWGWINLIKSKQKWLKGNRGSLLEEALRSILQLRANKMSGSTLSTGGETPQVLIRVFMILKEYVIGSNVEENIIGLAAVKEKQPMWIRKCRVLKLQSLPSGTRSEMYYVEGESLKEPSIK